VYITYTVIKRRFFDDPRDDGEWWIEKLQENAIIWRSAAVFHIGPVDSEYKPVQALLYWILT